MTTNSACVTKHTKYQPSNMEWRCPKCGTSPSDGGLCVEESAARDSSGSDNEIDCDGNHPDDFLRCYKCNFETSGKSFAASCEKKSNRVECGCCKGTGFVNKASKDDEVTTLRARIAELEAEVKMMRENAERREEFLCHMCKRSNG